MEEHLLPHLRTTREIEELLGLAKGTIDQQRHRGICPCEPYVLRVGKRRFLRWDIRDWETLLEREEATP